MSNWTEYVLGEIADVQTGPFGSQLHASDYVDFGIPSIMPKNIGQRLDINLDSIAYITEKDANRLQKYRVKTNDIVFSRRGDVEKCAFITDEMDGWLCGTGCLKVDFFSDATVIPKFMAYYFSTRESKHWLTSHAVGTTMPNLNSKILSNFPVELPSKSEQKAITAVLTSLDDKIDLLHRQNQTLEALAQTLFRHWFIDGADDDYEKGVIGDSCDVIDCLHSKKPEEIDSGIAEKYLLQVFNIAEGGKIDLKKKYFVSDEDYKEWTRRIELTGGELIISKTGRVGAIAQIPDFITTGIGRNLVAVRAKGHFTPEFLKDLMLSNWMNRKIHLNTSDGTILQSLHVKSISALPTIDPGKELIEKYSKMVKPIHKKITCNIEQIETLENLRDALLPKLMSGEVRVRL
ncbi:MAG: restriction endonuclease subunit S [Anaerolineales bacterium]|nr:restriction endonuclease subunit S [Anaerolineales bacterium]